MDKYSLSSARHHTRSFIVRVLVNLGFLLLFAAFVHGSPDHKHKDTDGDHSSSSSSSDFTHLSASEFSDNVLSTFGGNLDLSGHSISALGSGFVIAGSVTNPSGSPVSNFRDEPEISDALSKDRMAFLLHLDAAGRVRWAVRICLLPKDAFVHVAISKSDNAIFVAGAIALAKKTAGKTQQKNAQAQTQRESHLMLMRYSYSGSRLYKRTHGGPRARYTGLAIRTQKSMVKNGYITETSVVLWGEIWKETVLQLKQKGNTQRATKESVVLAEADTAAGKLKQQVVLTRGNNGAVESELIDQAALSTDSLQSRLFVLTRHSHVENFKYTITERLYSLNCSDLSVELAQRSFNMRTGAGQRLAVSKGNSKYPFGFVFVVLLEKGASSERLEVFRMQASLSPVISSPQWPEPFVHDIPPAKNSLRQAATTVIDAQFHPSSNVLSVLLTSSVAVTQAMASSNRRNANGRPAVMDVLENGSRGRAAQSDTEYTWLPVGMALTEKGAFVIGVDRGEFGKSRNKVKLGRILLTGIALARYGNQSGNGKGTNGGGGTVSGNAGCIGLSSFAAESEYSLLEDIRRDSRVLRVQKLPLLTRVSTVDGMWRRRKVGMLCMNFVPRLARLCATEGHVVRYRGELMYMSEACEIAGNCKQTWDVPLSFKARCEWDVVRKVFVAPEVEVVRGVMSATMHSGHAHDGVGAHEVAHAECDLQRKWWWMWKLRTL